MPRYEIRVNGIPRLVDTLDPNQPLLYALRFLGLTSVKYGCGLGQCGACTVIVDKKAVRSCMMPISSVESKPVTTLEGLGSADKPHPLQAAFIKGQVPQCGYCTSGMIMTAAVLLAETKKPTEAEVRAALDGNLCRCGTYGRVLRAVMVASGQGT